MALSPAAVRADATAGAAPKTATQIVADALIRLQAHIDVANRAMGEDQAEALGSRLADDLEAFDDPTPLAGYTKESYAERLRNAAQMDASIVDQVVAGTYEPLSGVTGLGERLVKSDADGTWQPVGIYVPRALKPNPSLVVLLHGNPQAESQLLAPPDFQMLADSTNTIIAAPWGRGNYDFYGVATDDVYQTAAEVAKAYAIEPHRVFLAGYSMGGFSVFKIGPAHGEVWHAVLCISGSILNSETSAVVRAWKYTPIYVVNGKLDDQIPPKYGEQTADWLAGQGVPTGFYQEPSGTHMIPTLMPALTRAWQDMIAGVVRNSPAVAQDANEGLPGSLNDPDLSIKKPPADLKRHVRR